MEFKKFTAGKWAYGRNCVPSEPQEENVCFDDSRLQEVLNEI